MAYDKGNLIELRDKITGYDEQSFGDFELVFDNLKDNHFSDEARNAFSAYYGSLDAAKDLHEALLPGLGWTVTEHSARIWNKIDFGATPASDSYVDETPSRAWLIAILEALISEASK